jgi:hypothetical protein
MAKTCFLFTYTEGAHPGRVTYFVVDAMGKQPVGSNPDPGVLAMNAIAEGYVPADKIPNSVIEKTRDVHGMSGDDYKHDIEPASGAEITEFRKNWQ